MNVEPFLYTQNLSKRFGSFVAIDQFDLKVFKGEVLGLLGPNGSGKSTLIRMLMGFLTPSTGVAKINGLDVIADRLAVHQVVSYLPSSPKLFRSMNGRQVLRFFANIRADGSFDRAALVARRLDLDLGRWVAFMSTGMRQKLAIAAAFSNEASVLILDEPTENLDPNIRSVVVELVQEAKGEGRTVLFSSHVLSEVEEVADRVAILSAGRLVHEQLVSDLKFCHRIVGVSSAAIPEIPAGIRSTTKIQKLGAGKIQIDVEGDLAATLAWLNDCQFREMYIEAAGLKAVYEQHHLPSKGVSS